MACCASTSFHLQLHLHPPRSHSRSRIGSGGSSRLTISAARRRGFGIRCAVGAEEETKKEKGVTTTTVKNGEDSLEICRVLNGMWQTSGGWGAIDRDNAVDAMYARFQILKNTWLMQICKLCHVIDATW